jgi:hypothetical protein
MADPFASRLKGLVASIKETRAELVFQVDRIGKMDEAKLSVAEKEHLEDLADGYDSANHYLGILLNYQRGRQGGV